MIQFRFLFSLSRTGLTFINFPTLDDKENWEDSCDAKKASAIMGFVWKLKLKVAYIVRGSDEEGKAANKRLVTNIRSGVPPSS